MTASLQLPQQDALRQIQMDEQSRALKGAQDLQKVLNQRYLQRQTEHALTKELVALLDVLFSQQES